MRVCVFGAGSLGSAIGGILAGKNEVTLIGRDPHMSVTRKEGLRLTGDIRRKVRIDARHSIADLESPDLIIVAVKAYDTPSVVRICRPWARDDTRVLTLQNGLGNHEQLRAWKGRAAFGGTTTMGAQLLAPGTVRVSGLGITTVGADMDRASAEEIAGCLASCGMPTRVEVDILSEIWSKAAVSACINPLTAVLRIPNGALLENDVLLRLISETSSECARVARSEGINLSSGEIVRRVHAVARDTRRNRSSMLRDVEEGRRTEVEQINGAFLHLGEKHGIATPLNRALTSILASLAGEGGLGKG